MLHYLSKEAAHVLNQLDLSETFVLLENNEILAMVNTLPLQIHSIQDLIRQIPCYQAVKQTSHLHLRNPETKPEKFNARVCFSIVSKTDEKIRYRVALNKWDDGSAKSVSLAKYLLTSIRETDVWRVAYSRMKSVKSHALIECVQGKNLGPVGMHNKFGGITVAVIEGGRPEDKLGRGANVIVVYPKNNTEAENISLLKKMRPELIDARLDRDSDTRMFLFYAANIFNIDSHQ